MTIDHAALEQAISRTQRYLLESRTARGYWEGHLATSALATATAVSALSLVDANAHDILIRRGLNWLSANVNADGGWGDTVDSPTNINTTALCWAAFGRAPCRQADWLDVADGAARWIEKQTGPLEPSRVVETILAFYGNDRTFSVPIVTMLALCGRLGSREQAFKKIPALPFELAAAPAQLWRWLRLPVVSYALPALVAIGQARFHAVPPRLLPLRLLRQKLCANTLKVVRRMQAREGGFLEAIPLTSFVAACLASIGHTKHEIVVDAVRFLVSRVRQDGGWPIDTSLSTWVTSLAVHACSIDGGNELDQASRQALREWLLGQQLTAVHPFTNVPPGGWAWMDSDGAVPDADDTPGALLALHALDDGRSSIQVAAENGVRWLLQLQNRDGGMPTFCRGWGKLPFDRSAPDITAHSLRAWHLWQERMPDALKPQIARAQKRAFRYLTREQRAEGCWLPLWFGNQASVDCTNPVYGTARVVTALANTGWGDDAMGKAGVAWLLQAQHRTGGWGGGKGGGASIEETALAIDALARWPASGPFAETLNGAIEKGGAWLLEATCQGRCFEPVPIGLYFSKLWYSERLYPVVFALAALKHVRRRLTMSTSRATMRDAYHAH